MQFQEIVTDVKVRFEKVSTKAQDLAKTSLDTFKQANGVVVESAKTVAKSQQGVAKELFGAAKASVAKAREAGLQEVVAKPVDFLPAGKDQIVKAFEETRDTLVKTRNELSKLLKDGYNAIIVEINGKPAKKAPVKRAAAKKAPAKVAAAKKAAPKAAEAQA